MNFAKSFSDWRTTRRAIRELNALSQRELDDLGIHRSNINQVVRNGR